MQPIIIPITREKLEAKRKEAADAGFVIAGDHGTASYSNVAIRYDYDGTSLTIVVTHKPFLYPAPAVAQAIQNWFN